jgi:hypothetical protein
MLQSAAVAMRAASTSVTPYTAFAVEVTELGVRMLLKRAVSARYNKLETF